MRGGGAGCSAAPPHRRKFHGAAGISCTADSILKVRTPAERAVRKCFGNTPCGISRYEERRKPCCPTATAWSDCRRGFGSITRTDSFTCSRDRRGLHPEIGPNLCTAWCSPRPSEQQNWRPPHCSAVACTDNDASDSWRPGQLTDAHTFDVWDQITTSSLSADAVASWRACELTRPHRCREARARQTRRRGGAPRRRAGPRCTCARAPLRTRAGGRPRSAAEACSAAPARPATRPAAPPVGRTSQACRGARGAAAE